MKTCQPQNCWPSVTHTWYNDVFYVTYFASLMLVHENMNFMQVMLPEAVAIVAAPTDPTR
jgi:hypothetical protein